MKDFDDLERRVEDLKLAILALAAQEFGDSPGHDFHGNQYGGGSANSSDGPHSYAVSSVAGGDLQKGDRVINPRTQTEHEISKIVRPSRSVKEDPHRQWTMLHLDNGKKVEVHNGDIIDVVDRS